MRCCVKITGGLQLLGEDALKTSNFAKYLREVFQPGTDPMTMEVAAATLGHLVKSGGALTADIVEFEVRISQRESYTSAMSIKT